MGEAQTDRCPLRPLVTGLPRSGYSLLGSVLTHFLPMRQPEPDLRQALLNCVVATLGSCPAQAVTSACARHGLADRLVYSPAFRELTGGPKWLHPERDDAVLVRKYIGVRGLGDFTLVFRHPRQVLDSDPVVQSHVDGPRWPAVPAFASRQRFVSIRNPYGVVNSALLSLNALTSEYITRFLPQEKDTAELREHLALYKFSDLEFFSGIVRYCRAWHDAFLPVRAECEALRWEDLIERPVASIRSLAESVGLPVDDAHAAQIWSAIGHRNLTGAHGHNFRPGGGKVGDWRRWFTTAHVEIMREHGFDDICRRYGYGPAEMPLPGVRTPFQARVGELLEKGQVYRDYPDRDLFCFAFNKSNIDASHFKFQHFGWREASQVERAQFSDAALLEDCWEAADRAAVRLNAVLETLLCMDDQRESEARERVREASSLIREQLSGTMPRAAKACIGRLEQLVAGWYREGGRRTSMFFGPPRLVRSVDGCNVVALAGRFVAVPQEAGPIDLETVPLERIPGAFAAEEYREVLDTLRAAGPGVPAAQGCCAGRVRRLVGRLAAWLKGGT